MDPIWKLTGWVRLRLTSAQPEGRLREFARQIRLERIEFIDSLTAEFDTSAGDARKLRLLDGERLEKIGGGGLPRLLGILWQWRIFTAAVVLLGFLTVLLPTRIWFVEVRGNGDVPAALILEKAADCGVSFGASRRALRSEQVKNHLLWAIPELRWAGVNTEGCVAVITVALRQEADAPASKAPGDVVAALDAVVTEIFPQTGNALATPGQAVRAGEILISGTTDLGLTFRSDRAAGEVYGLTRRTFSAVLPEKHLERGDISRMVRKFSLRIGKKYVNFSNDSGILYGTCVKMRKVNDLTLPGGFVLPVALVTDTYLVCDTEQVSREISVEEILAQVRRYAREQMTAGAILSEESRLTGTALTAVLECREMIGAFRPGIYTEGDIHERENSERGAG